MFIDPNELKSYLKTIVALVFFPLGAAHAQFGPGGVGSSSSNGLWLIADSINQSNGTGVSLWPDLSGNGNNAIQSTPAFEPTFAVTGNINGRSAVVFDGTDQMEVPDANILDGSAGISYFTVLRPTGLNNAARGIVGKRITFSTNVQYAYTFFFFSSNRLYLDIHTSNNRFNTTASFSNSTNYLAAMTFDGSLAAASRSKIYSGGTLLQTGTESSTVIPNSDQPVAIGALNVDYGTYFIGEMSEIIHFNFCPNSAQRIIIENYLGAKYGISIANDLFTHQATYNHDVAGIGRVDASNLHTDAQGLGRVRILNPTGLDNNEYYIWGHDNGSLAFNNTDFSTVEMLGRLDRVWRATETGSITDFDVRFDLSGLTVGFQPEDLVLMIDTDDDGVFSDETSAGGGLIIGSTLVAAGVYEFAGVTGLNNNLRFTVGFTNASAGCQFVSTDGYTVNISIDPVDIIPSSLTCPFGYNYNIDIASSITFNGLNIPASLFTLQGTINCGASSHFFDLPNSGGSGSVVSVSNVYNTNTDCATATVASLNCTTASIEVQGPGIPYQNVACAVGTVLPIELISFSAKLKNERVHLEWKTASEIDNDFFEVMRSSDGSRFQTIDIVDAVGNSNELMVYSYIDQPRESDVVYYQLKQVDIDGKSTLSEVVAVEFDESIKTLNQLIYLDANQRVTIPLIINNNQSLEVEVMDVRGNIILSKALRSQELNLPNIASGIYFLRVSGKHIQPEIFRLVAP